MKIRTVLMMTSAFAVLLMGCADQPSEDAPVAVAPGEAAGFLEYPIGDDQVVEWLNVAAVYFQPVPLEPVGMGLAPENSDIHIEADISAAAENKVGFGAGDWVPYLTVRYQIAKDGKVQEGTFMTMNASDGPHYGANIKLDGAGTYSVKFLIESPEKNGHYLHVDKVTGVEGRFWREPLEVSWNFDYIPRQW